jgi:hypothetical protein
MSLTMTNRDTKILSFLNELRDLLDRHGARLEMQNCEIYLKSEGYIEGYLEDNVEVIEIIDEEGITLHKSKQKSLD